jgi:hypothetical protein
VQKDKEYWQGIVCGVNALMHILKRKPRKFKLGLICNPGGILNAYREGDLTFDQATKELEAWKDRKVRDALSAQEEPLVHSESQRDMRLRMGF